MRKDMDITRKDLEMLCYLLGVDYRKACIWQGLYVHTEVKLYVLEFSTFAYVEQIDPFEGGIIGYFFLEGTPQNVYDLQHWQVAPGVEINVMERMHGMGNVSRAKRGTTIEQQPLDTVFEDGLYRVIVPNESPL